MHDGITLFVDTDELLRKKWSKLPSAEAAFRCEAKEQVSRLGRRPLSGDVSVELGIYAPDQGQQPHIPGVVKAYIDALQGVAYHSDRQIGHLVAHRRALDHPLLRAAMPEAPSNGERRYASVFVEVMPLAYYTQLFDRAFRLTLWRGGARSPWMPTWSPRKEANLVKLRREQKSTGPDAALTDVVRALEEEKLRDGFLADIDRPGPLPKATKAMHRVLPLPRLHWLLRRAHGGVIFLPLRGEEPGTSASWREAVDTSLRQFRAKRRGLPFDGFVALDVAVRGESRQGKDLDNLVHGFLIPFEEQLCSRRGTVVGYRAYAAAGKPRGVQVRVLDDARLLELSATLSETRTKPTLEERLRRLTGQ